MIKFWPPLAPHLVRLFIPMHVLSSYDYIMSLSKLWLESLQKFLMLKVHIRCLVLPVQHCDNIHCYCYRLIDGCTFTCLCSNFDASFASLEVSAFEPDSAFLFDALAEIFSTSNMRPFYDGISRLHFRSPRVTILDAWVLLCKVLKWVLLSKVVYWNETQIQNLELI